MARLPDVEPDAVQGQDLPMDAVRPTDFGLTQAASGFRQAESLDFRSQYYAAKEQAKADQQAVAPALTSLQEQLGAQLSTDAPNWNGTPGLAADQIRKGQQLLPGIIQANPGWTPGRLAEFQRGAQAHISQFGDQVVDYENRYHQQQAVDQQEITLNGLKTQLILGFGADRQSLLDNYDGSQAGLTQSVLSSFDSHAQSVLGTAPAQLQEHLQAEFSAMRTQTAAETVPVEAHAQNTYVVTNGTNQADALINSVASNPLSFNDVLTHGLPGILATMPASDAVKRDLGRQWQAMAVEARLKGMVNRGQASEAQGELNDGRYDAVLSPEQRDQLASSVDAGVRDHAPKSLDQALAQRQIGAQADAETTALATTGRSTGQVNLDQIVTALGPEAAARYQQDWTTARQTFSTVGAIRDMPSAQVAAQAAAAPPDPSDPAYASKIVQWQVARQAADAELKARQDPGAWAFSSTTKTPGVPRSGAGAAGAATAGPQDRGALLQSLWQTAQGGDAHAGAQLAGWSLGTQFGAGIPASAWQLVPQTEAAKLAASVISSAPEGRLQALQNLAGVVQAVPASMHMPNGVTLSPRDILTRQLLAAHLSPVEVSAITDFGTDPAKMGRYVAALNDPTIAKPEPGPAGKQLTGFVNAALAPYLNTAQPMPGNETLAQARIARTTLIARELMASQNMDAKAAAQAAAGDLTNGYRYVDTWRMPTAQAAGWSVNPANFGVEDGAGLARIGAGKMLGALTANNGANLYAPSSLPGQPADQRRLYAAQVQHTARWVTTPDDGGLMLMVPHPDGTFDPVADRWGRPVRAGWDDLKGQAQGTSPAPFQPPPNAVQGPNGTPLPATSKAAAFNALSGAVVHRESGGVGGQVSSAGALGRWQVTPDTVSTYAPRLGLPVDLGRAQNDNDYNQRIGQAALSDNLNHYGTGAGIGLALAAYNAGRGRLEGYTDTAGQYHPGWLATIGDPRTGKISLTDWAARIPIKETRDYVEAVLPDALRRLQDGG